MFVFEINALMPSTQDSTAVLGQRMSSGIKTETYAVNLRHYQFVNQSNRHPMTRVMPARRVLLYPTRGASVPLGCSTTRGRQLKFERQPGPCRYDLSDDQMANFEARRFILQSLVTANGARKQTIVECIFHRPAGPGRVRAAR